MLRAMNGLIEELDYCECPLGEIILRRRKILSLDGEIVYDVILNDEFLMCSLFHAAVSRLDPHRSRCAPKIHRSPGRLTGSAGG